MNIKQNLLKTIERANSEFLNQIYEAISEIISNNNLSIEINEFGGFQIDQYHIPTFIIDSFNKLPIASEKNISLVYKSRKIVIQSTNESFFDEIYLKFYEEKENNYSLKVSSMSLTKKINEDCVLDYLFGQDNTYINFQSNDFFVSGFSISHCQDDQFSLDSNLENVKNKFDSDVNSFFVILADITNKRKEDVINYLFKGKDFSQEEKDLFFISQDLNIDDYKFLQIDFTNKNEINYKPKI